MHENRHKKLGWFLIIMCKDHTLSRNHPILCFWLRREGQAKFLCSSLTFTTQEANNACSPWTPCHVYLKSKMLCIHRFSASSSSPRLFGNIEEFRAKSYFTDQKQLIQFSYLLLEKEIFLVASFSEQVAAKGNSL